MSASPAVMGQGGAGQMSSPERGSQVAVPAKWRVGQFIFLGLILALAVYYFTIGWKSPDAVEVARRTPADAIGFLILAGLVWLTTPTAGVIAWTTFQEAVRRRWMTALLGFALVLLALSSFFNWMQPGEEEKFLRDFGTGFIIIITLLMSIFLGVALVPPEVERRTIFTILSKPVNRLEFLIGKFMGLALTLLINLLLMAAMFLISYTLFKLRREGFGPAMEVRMPDHPGLMFDLANVFKAILLHYGQLCIMSALALTLSLIVSSITAIVFCFLAYFGGQMSSYWEHLAGGEHAADAAHGASGLSKPVQGVVNAVYYMLPRLDRFDVRERLINDTPIAFNYMWKAFGSGLIYVAVLLTVAYLIFSDREF